MKKKLMALVTITAMAAALLSGCSSPAPSNTAPSNTASAKSPETTAAVSEKKADWPAKQITIVCPFSPGGSGDTIARLIAPELQEKLGVPVVVTNKTGAGGAVGLEAVKNAPADGYTLVYFSVDTCILKPMGVTDITCEDFTALGRAIVNPSALTVKADSPYQTMQEFIDAAKENPGMLSEGNSGTGAFWHICASAFADAAGIELNHVPFDGAATAAAALMGGNVDSIFVAPGEIKSSIDSGDFRVLANLGESRSLSAQDVETGKEQGLDVTIQGWGGLAVRKETPAEIVEVLQKAFDEAVQGETVKNAILERGLDYNYATGEQLNEAASQQLKDFTALIDKLGLANK